MFLGGLPSCGGGMWRSNEDGRGRELQEAHKSRLHAERQASPNRMEALSETCFV